MQLHPYLESTKTFSKQQLIFNITKNFSYPIKNLHQHCQRRISYRETYMQLQESRMMSHTILGFLMLNIFCCAFVESRCSQGCDALASYYIWPGTNLTFISSVFSTTISNIMSHNPQISDQNAIQAYSRLTLPFSCGCINNEFMAHRFVYEVRPGNYYERIAEVYYSNLTTVGMLERFNTYSPENISVGAELSVPVNCSCGSSSVSKDYGLFVSYPLRSGESLSSLANGFGLPERLLQDYNPGIDFSSGNGLVFIPGKGI